MKKSPLFLGIDVGTGSARAGIFTAGGALLASSSKAIRMWKPAADLAQQSSEDIWAACCHATQAALRDGGIRPEAIQGIGFDATCSLVALDADDHPVSLCPEGSRAQNVIVWMDHRAIGEAVAINATKHRVLRYVGGAISPEMQTPKLLWIKKHLPKAWQKTARFFDLPDFLTYRATGNDTRSLCSVVCKWTYLGHLGLDGKGWDASYFRAIGLGELADEQFSRIGQRIRPMGEALSPGLSARAAKELGLRAGTAVGVSIIDAHAGGVGVLGARLKDQAVDSALFNHRLALIGGTSSCHMAVSPKPRYISGVWGPYYSAMIPDWWLTEGGQSATGALIDHIIQTHPAATVLGKTARKNGQTIYECLNARLEQLAHQGQVDHPAQLTRDFHIQPDFHGNRSPRANPHLKGMKVGLTLTAGEDDLAVQYLAAIQAVAYGTRHIIATLNRKGYAIDTLMACGGGTKNPVFLREHANITGCRLVLPREPEAVLLGGAVLAAVAAGRAQSVVQGMAQMNRAGKTIKPTSGQVADYHDRKYRIFLQMHDDFQRYRRVMAG